MRAERVLGRTILAVVLSAMACAAQAETIATFADPSSNGSMPVFVNTNTFLDGGWDQPGLDLVSPLTEEIYEDVTFEMTPLLITGRTFLSGGTITFEHAGAPLFVISFDSAYLSPFGFGASSLVTRDNVTFSGPLVSSVPEMEDEFFAFSFANYLVHPDGVAWTAAFTSSATIVPEPTALLGMSFGLVLLLRRR